MKTLHRTQPVVIELSPLTCNVTDDSGNGLVGFTANYSDGTFKNITLTFCPDTLAAVQTEIANMRQLLESSLSAVQAAKLIDNVKIKETV